MNIKQIDAQIEKLNKKKELAEEKKKKMIDQCNAEIESIKNDIAQFNKVKADMERLEKLQQEQMEKASQLMKKA